MTQPKQEKVGGSQGPSGRVRPVHDGASAGCQPYPRNPFIRYPGLAAERLAWRAWQLGSSIQGQRNTGTLIGRDVLGAGAPGGVHGGLGRVRSC